MTVRMNQADYTMPSEVPLTVIFGEGGGEQITERWGEISWRAIDLIKVGERDGWDSPSTAVGTLLTARRELRKVIMTVRTSRNPEDFSWGLAHISYQNVPVSDGSYSVENMMLCRAWCFDPMNSLPFMLERLQQYWDIHHDTLKTAFMWNAPGLNGRAASYNGDGGRAITANYTRGREQARAWMDANL